MCLVNQESVIADKVRRRIHGELQCQLEECRKRLRRLYGALETGQLSIEDLAPRIKQLRLEINQLEAREIALKSTTAGPIDISREEVASMLNEFQNLLLGGTFAQKKQFLRSFIRRIVVPMNGDADYGEGREGELEYALPLAPLKTRETKVCSDFEVLSAVQAGSPLFNKLVPPTATAGHS